MVKTKTILLPVFEINEAKNVTVPNWSEATPILIQIKDVNNGNYYNCSNWWVSNGNLILQIKNTTQVALNEHNVSLIYML